MFAVLQFLIIIFQEQLSQKPPTVEGRRGAAVAAGGGKSSHSGGSTMKNKLRAQLNKRKAQNGPQTQASNTTAQTG